MKDSEKGLLFIGALLIGAVVLQGYQPPAGQVVLPMATPAVQTDGVTVYTGTPTVEWYAEDAITGRAVVPGHFRVTIGSSTAELAGNDTANASVGDAYTICLMPNSTYYGACTSSVIRKTVEKISLKTYALGTATIWINNDPENSTTRNATTAEDTLAASDTDTPTVCFQGATADASYGDGAVLVSIDYNANQLQTAPTFSVGTLCAACRPDGYSNDANATASVFYEVLGTLTNQQTVCGSMTVQNDSTDDVEQKSPEVHLVDRALFRHSVSDDLVEAYERPTTGVDTNSATNATAVYYYIN